MTQQSAQTSGEQPKEARLPCRGCLSTCSNYDRCGGKPWRTAAGNG